MRRPPAGRRVHRAIRAPERPFSRSDTFCRWVRQFDELAIPLLRLAFEPQLLIAQFRGLQGAAPQVRYNQTRGDATNNMLKIVPATVIQRLSVKDLDQ